MKRFILLSSALLLLGGVACAGYDHPISREQLPATAQLFLSEYYHSSKVTIAKRDGNAIEREYDVTLDNGTHIEFRSNGEWRKVESREPLPRGVVPPSITTYVSKGYPSDSILKIERDRRGYEVTLSSGMELTFDRRFRVVDIDN